MQDFMGNGFPTERIQIDYIYVGHQATAASVTLQEQQLRWFCPGDEGVPYVSLGKVEVHPDSQYWFAHTFKGKRYTWTVMLQSCSSLRSNRSAPYPSPYTHRSASPTAYSDSLSTCLSMLPSHDNWSSLQVPSHSGMLPMSHSGTSGSSSSQHPSLWSLSSSSLTPVS
ncbi:T-box transcription factor T-like [Brienomyrus brachyistius]|uniref:T-box transcription factor T-like n=1 Tax=Brienomyrus brachyistius TaxID=42636 RepID=UPI0020B194ED|nr:T-box transcription factor T-like [Brienomyrus brachyistius]XP_048874055.1 T-box transcription factor T-like [Brienomyrus brachyistius]